MFVSHLPQRVLSHSPGLRAERATLGNVDSYEDFTPTGFRRGSQLVTKPRRGKSHSMVHSQGSSLRKQPWAMCRNSFGVNAEGLAPQPNINNYPCSHLPNGVLSLLTHRRLGIGLHKRLPACVTGIFQGQDHRRIAVWLRGLLEQLHPSLTWRATTFSRIALHATADNVLPSGSATE